MKKLLILTIFFLMLANWCFADSTIVKIDTTSLSESPLLLNVNKRDSLVISWKHDGLDVKGNKEFIKSFNLYYAKIESPTQKSFDFTYDGSIIVNESPNWDSSTPEIRSFEYTFHLIGIEYTKYIFAVECEDAGGNKSVAALTNSLDSMGSGFVIFRDVYIPSSAINISIK